MESVAWLTTTASIGVAMLSDVEPRGTPESIARELARKAGRAVFAAKDRGRDQVARWESRLDLRDPTGV